MQKTNQFVCEKAPFIFVRVEGTFFNKGNIIISQRYQLHLAHVQLNV
jgi:hypothetical protein